MNAIASRPLRVSAHPWHSLSSALLGSVSVGRVRAAGRPVSLVPASAGEAPAG